MAEGPEHDLDSGVLAVLASEQDSSSTLQRVVELQQLLARHWWTFARFGLTPQKLAARALNRTEPKILCNSLPKAGTHLLERALCLHPRLYRKFVPTISDQKIHRWNGLDPLLARVRPGQIVLCHLHFKPEYRQSMAECGIRSIFLIRDPRDVVVSQAFYIAGEKRHPLHQLFARQPSLKERLKIAIQGDAAHGLPSVGQRLDEFGGWLGASDLVVRFEDLIGAEGGGSMRSQREALRALYFAVGLSPQEELLDSITQQLFSSASPTFRRGRTGEWRECFDLELQELFQYTAADQLVRYGYSDTRSVG